MTGTCENWNDLRVKTKENIITKCSKFVQKGIAQIQQKLIIQLPTTLK